MTKTIRNNKANQKILGFSVEDFELVIMDESSPNKFFVRKRDDQAMILENLGSGAVAGAAVGAVTSLVFSAGIFEGTALGIGGGIALSAAFVLAIHEYRRIRDNQKND